MPPMTNAVTSDRPILFVECTNTYHSPVQTGIQRVVRNILRDVGDAAALRGYDLMPVVFEGGQFRVAELEQVLLDKLRDVIEPAVSATSPPNRRRLRAMLARPPREILLTVLRPAYRGLRRVLAVLLPFPAAQRFLFAPPFGFGLAWCILLPLRVSRRILRRFVPPPISVVAADPELLDDGFGISMDAFETHRGNFLILLDNSWSIPLWSAVERFETAGGSSHAVIYDLVPVLHVNTVPQGLEREFTEWVAQHLRLSGRFVTITHAVAAELQAFLPTLQTRGGTGAACRISTFYLGSGLDFADSTAEPRPEVVSIFTGPESGADHVFIIVGSIEPRKNHGYALDAFDRLWASGSQACLVVIGRFGWKNKDVLERIETHEMYGRRLFLMRDIDDSELDYAYRQASALIISSRAEGFGLPIVEAFQRGLPVLCSDIPVFRELADGRASFFDLADPIHLVDAVNNFTARHDPMRRTERNPQPWLTWRESSEQLLDCVLGSAPPAASAAPEPQSAAVPDGHVPMRFP